MTQFSAQSPTGNPETYLKNYGSGRYSTSNGPTSTYTSPSTSTNTKTSEYQSSSTYSQSNSSYSSTYSKSTGSYIYSQGISTPAYQPLSEKLTYLKQGEILQIEDRTPLHVEPDPNSNTITYVSGNLTFIKDANQYIFVENKDYKGYVNKIFVNEKAMSNTRRYARYSDSLNKEVRVFIYSPILEKPDAKSKVIGTADNRRVVLLSLFDEEFFRIRLGKIQGYMSKSWLDNY